MNRPPLVQAFSVFFVVGGLSTALQYIILIALTANNIDPILASTGGYAISGVLNYYLNYRFSFKSSERHRDALPRFAVAAGIGLAINWALMYVGIRILGIHYLVAQILTTACVMLSNFVLGREWTFRDRGQRSPGASLGERTDRDRRD